MERQPQSVIKIILCWQKSCAGTIYWNKFVCTKKIFCWLVSARRDKSILDQRRDQWANRWMDKPSCRVMATIWFCHKNLNCLHMVKILDFDAGELTVSELKLRIDKYLQICIVLPFEGHNNATQTWLYHCEVKKGNVGF